MKIIKVIPILKSISKGELSYFTTEENVPLGSIVKIPVRNKMTHGIVVGTEKAEDIKAEIKSSPFAVRKVEKIHPESFLSPEFIESAQKTAVYFATSTSSILNSLIPKKILENLSKIKTQSDVEKTTSIYEQFVTQTDEDERFANYRSLIREEFARRSSVFFCLPTIEDIKKAKTTLEKGIEKYTFVIHNSLSAGEIIKIWNSIMEENHPILIISTGSFLSLPRKDIGTIVLEKENSRVYKTQTRPYLDIRNFVEIFSNKIKAKLLLGDSLLRTETLWRQKSGEFLEFRPLKFRSLSTSEQKLIDIKKHNEQEKKSSWEIISDEISSLIKENKDSNENLFIFCVRKGLYPTTICGDCGQTVLCTNCDAPVVLHTLNKTNFFLCHRCGEKRSSEERCTNCESWKLVPLGVGIERIEKEILEKFPNVKVFRMDKDSVPTHKKALSIIEKFRGTPGSVMIGTEMALIYLNEKIDNTAVISIDPLFSVPDFRINEKIMNILLKMRSIAQRKFILQTRNPEQKILDYAIKGNLMDFYRDEIEQRKMFGYPPYSVIVKITLQGQKSAVMSEMEKLTELFAPHEFIVFPAYSQALKGKYAANGIIKISRNSWPDNSLVEKLRSLPPQFMVKIDPESVL